MRLILLVFTVLALALSACGEDGGGAAATPSTDVATAAGGLPTSMSGLPVIDLRYDGGTMRVEVARTPDDRTQGLSGRDGLAEGTGMLFDLEEARVPGFWMKDMRFPIDMVWIDESKTVVGVALDVQPQPGVADEELRRYSPEAPVRYVLEIVAGASLELGIAEGDVVAFELPE